MHSAVAIRCRKIGSINLRPSNPAINGKSRERYHRIVLMSLFENIVINLSDNGKMYVVIYRACKILRNIRNWGKL